jgi:hypothetical protein
LVGAAPPGNNVSAHFVYTHIDLLEAGAAMSIRIPLAGIILAGLLASCTPSAPSAGTGAAATAVVITAVAGGSTAVPLTAIRGGTEPAPGPSVQPATPIPTLAGGLSPAQLKYRLLDQFPDFFYCDPDTYPVARADETQLAIQHFPEIRANTEEFQAILDHNGLSGLGSFSDAEKLQIYGDYKKLAAIAFSVAPGGYQFELRIAEGKQGFQVKGLIDGEGRTSILDKTPTLATCPICLAAWVLIDTPSGPVPVTELKVGQLVWTQDASGRRVAAPVLQVASVQVPATHEVVHVALSDGRQVWASPGHPTADGRRLGDLQIGDPLDGGRIVRFERVQYGLAATYDLLPAGGTGRYWADGILLGSTLVPR